jgi:hypothetical protein
MKERKKERKSTFGLVSRYCPDNCLKELLMMMMMMTMITTTIIIIIIIQATFWLRFETGKR